MVSSGDKVRDRDQLLGLAIETWRQAIETKTSDRHKGQKQLRQLRYLEYKSVVVLHYVSPPVSQIQLV
jgi:hypothetical protein